MADGQRRVPFCCLTRERQSATAAQGAPGGHNLGEKDDDVSEARIRKSKARIKGFFSPFPVINLKQMMHSGRWAPKQMSVEV